jgi:hypothetical protein
MNTILDDPFLTWFQAWSRGRSLAGTAVSNPIGIIDVSVMCFVLSGRFLGDEPISFPEESYLLCFIKYGEVQTTFLYTYRECEVRVQNDKEIIHAILSRTSYCPSKFIATLNILLLFL